MKNQPLDDYDRYNPPPTPHDPPIPDHEKYERRATRRGEITGAIWWLLIILAGMILKRLLLP